MPIRWYIAPVVTITTVEEGVAASYRATKIALYTDPATLRSYPAVSWISDLDEFGTRCLSFVRGYDWTPLDADNQLINILERDYEDMDYILDLSPRQDGWKPGRVNNLVAKLNNADINTTGLTIDSPFWMWLERVGQIVRPGADVRNFWVPG